jgi:ankyrin repeat protein
MRKSILVLFVVISPFLSFTDINQDLIEAADSGETDKVRALLEEGADVHATDDNGLTALWKAAAWGYTEIVRSLLDAGADVNTKAEDGSTFLMLSANNGYLDVVKLLLDMEADVHRNCEALAECRG